MSHVPAGVDGNVVTGDVAGGGGDEEPDGIGDVGLLHEPAEGRLGGEVGVDLLGCPPEATIRSIRAPLVTFGQTSLTVMPYCPSSSASVRVRPRIAHFDDE